MLNELLFLLLISISYGCIPTTSVTTTTVAPNVTTTTASSNATTTTVVTTTTASESQCCAWPLVATSVNNVTPNMTSWNGCNETISFTCSLSSFASNSSLDGNGVLANANATTSITQEYIVAQNVGEATNLTLTCNTTSHLWANNRQLGEYYSFSCIYKYSNGTWVFNDPSFIG